MPVCLPFSLHLFVSLCLSGSSTLTWRGVSIVVRLAKKMQMVGTEGKDKEVEEKNMWEMKAREAEARVRK